MKSFPNPLPSKSGQLLWLALKVIGLGADSVFALNSWSSTDCPFAVGTIATSLVWIAFFSFRIVVLLEFEEFEANFKLASE